MEKNRISNFNLKVKLFADFFTLTIFNKKTTSFRKKFQTKSYSFKSFLCDKF